MNRPLQSDRVSRGRVRKAVLSFSDMLSETEIPYLSPIAKSFSAALKWALKEGHYERIAFVLKVAVFYPLVAPLLGALLLIGLGYVSTPLQRAYARIIHAGFRLEDSAAEAIAAENATLDYYQALNVELSPTQQTEPRYTLLLSKGQKAIFRVRDTSMRSTVKGQCESISITDMDKPIIEIFVGGKRIFRRARSRDASAFSMDDKWWKANESEFEAQNWRRKSGLYDLPLEVKLTTHALTMGGKEQCLSFMASISIEVYKKNKHVEDGSDQEET